VSAVSATSHVIETRPGEYAVVSFRRDFSAPAEPVGVVLLDAAANQAYVRFRRDWTAFAPGEADVLESIEGDMQRAATEMGAAAFLAWLEDTLSNDLSVADREKVMLRRPERTLDDLYKRHVASTVLPYQTHLPMYSARAAATKFSEQQQVSETGEWREIPAGIRLQPNMFIARVVGASMEPRIPSGSLCIFRHGVSGSRQGRLVLVENRSASETERYTIKQYWSEKRQTEDGWAHTKILLQPLNPDFEAWELDEDGQYAVIAEFVEVLEANEDPGEAGL